MKQKLLFTILALLGFGLAEVQAQSYLNNRSRWTEIRLDTLLYDSWYSAVETEAGTTYVPNFEIVNITSIPKCRRSNMNGVPMICKM